MSGEKDPVSPSLPEIGAEFTGLLTDAKDNWGGQNSHLIVMPVGRVDSMQDGNANGTFRLLGRYEDEDALSKGWTQLLKEHSTEGIFCVTTDWTPQPKGVMRARTFPR